MSPGVALEINRASIEMTRASYEARDALAAFNANLTHDISVDPDMLADKWTEGVCLTIVFPDGLTMSYSMDTWGSYPLGGLPLGTIVYINTIAFEVGDGCYYLVKADEFTYSRLTAAIYDSRT